MPELPEVETVRRGLERLIAGKKIESADVRVPKMVKTGAEDFQLDILGQTFESIGRRGKYLIFDLGRQVLISHLRMEGKYLLFKDEPPVNKHFHLFFGLDDGSTLVYQDVRKFGTFELLEKSQLEDYFTQKKIGPEPNERDFKLKPFEKGLAKSHKAIKTILLDQHLVAGLGNIYVDEVLWAAKIHPERLSNQLKKSEIKRIHDETIDILQLAIKKGGSTIRTYRNALGEDGTMQNFLQVYAKTDEPCARCATPIEKIKVGGRGTHFCPSCQKR
ncbi:DNA-formamidopyrimidine glycosylase [Streptococcus macacae]|uniref:Formamidopyrimidine-DNA glycosylase n=1 Tax=Streptococcus macacae NCTC 11558 TaxID=764298 RepID=G5JYI0_9STRE|nr:DNA-formamidopyrimidine glycosylase [Streptococcus macacae]EHJ52838.1 DNA-formamidopyrimidine glycosylase [Streptococcus macacae NCTC 11558]SUN78093.1 formamidopyrimidine-DNA glycosylase [Streptococcus macacae NCTC 11558]